MTGVVRRGLASLVLLLAAVGLAGCNGTIAAIEPALSNAESDDEEFVGREMIGKPYRVGGRWYHPRKDENYDEVGVASWYGPKFHGNETANGERFDQYGLTAAHPTLPLPSFVRVTVVETGKSAVLRLNDRGPFSRGRIIDVSKKAAETLGFRHQGTAKVRVQYLGPAPVGGGDRETLMAAAKFGDRPSGKKSAGEGRSLRNLLPFGRGRDEEDEGRDVEVRLASSDPVRGETPPGVRAAAYVPPPTRESEPETAAAYAGTDVPEEESAAIDALIALNSEPEEPEAKKPAEPLRPLPAAAIEASGARVMGAHELFGAIDDAAGGAGELRGAGQPQ